jgi:hypothetical protein
MRGAKRGLDRYFRLSADLDQGVVGWHIAGSFQRRQSEIGLPDLSSQKNRPPLGTGARLPWLLSCFNARVFLAACGLRVGHRRGICLGGEVLYGL